MPLDSGWLSGVGAKGNYIQMDLRVISFDKVARVVNKRLFSGIIYGARLS
jgi:hypothetical protein